MANNTHGELPSEAHPEEPAKVKPIDRVLTIIRKLRDELNDLERLAKGIKEDMPAAPKPEGSASKKGKDGKKKKKSKTKD